MKMNDLGFKEGQELKISIKPNHSCDSFVVDIGLDSDNIALHFNPRFDYSGDSNTIVCNSLSGGSWGEEQREGNFPFSRGDECKVCINFNNEQFYIRLPDGRMMNFPNRLGEFKYEYFKVSGDVEFKGVKMA
ncbi:galectin-1-like [Melanotaenia boesemani]|uniref:galectin-1-like n=1 Tax=Melanotaenia boesemani TaxID=1250792 RepID=UPI001C049689|nr:galectin-1-like [Melanotaenia boesemani]